MLSKSNVVCVYHGGRSAGSKLPEGCFGCPFHLPQETLTAFSAEFTFMVFHTPMSIYKDLETVARRTECQFN